jgi:hypothetical protein
MLTPSSFAEYSQKTLANLMPFYRPFRSAPIKERHLHPGNYRISEYGNCFARALLVLAIAESVAEAKPVLDLTLNKKSLIHAKAGIQEKDSEFYTFVNTGSTGGLLGFGTTEIQNIGIAHTGPGVIRGCRNHRIISPDEISLSALGIRGYMSWPEMKSQILMLLGIAIEQSSDVS